MSDSEQRTNAEWAAIQIQKHGKDRYPGIKDQFIKLVEEVGELGKALNKYMESTNSKGFDNVYGEAADVALVLYNIADKVKFDLDQAIMLKVTRDARDFRDKEIKPLLPNEGLYGAMEGYWLDDK